MNPPHVLLVTWSTLSAAAASVSAASVGMVVAAADAQAAQGWLLVGLGGSGVLGLWWKAWRDDSAQTARIQAKNAQLGDRDKQIAERDSLLTVLRLQIEEYRTLAEERRVELVRIESRLSIAEARLAEQGQ